MLNETLNATIGNNQAITTASSGILHYFISLPTAVMQGNTVAIIISLLLIFVSILLINAISSLILSILKRTILFAIIILIIWDFFPRYIEIIKAEGWGFSTILIGIVAVIASGVGLYMASRSFVLSIKNNFSNLKERLSKEKELKKEEALKKEMVAEAIQKQQQSESVKNMFSKEAINNEKSLLAVLVYLIVAEFGVFSSPTLSAPTTQVGLMFFATFIIGVLIFTKSSYKNFKTATTYFGVTFLAGLALSFALGILWGKNTLPELLSLNFFTSDSLVAMITGMGVSLFAGSKG